MDLLKIIRQKSKALEKDISIDGIRAVIKHIEAAEQHLYRAMEERDVDYFNDVIYRTNQAFEGMLKEAYCSLTGRESVGLSPHQIEQYLLEETVFSERVLNLFTNYRKKWRNPSTHDHKLFFNEQEAFLAIVSISAFTSILMDQIIENVNFHREQGEIEKRREAIKGRVPSYDIVKFDEQIVLLLKEFSDEIMLRQTNLAEIREVEIIGLLGGFITSIDPQIEINREPLISREHQLRPDLILVKGKEEVVIEIRRARKGFYFRDKPLNQMLLFLSIGNFNNGVLYFPPYEKNQEIEVRREKFELSGREVNIIIISPINPKTQGKEVSMIDLGLFFTEDEMKKLFEMWASEGREFAEKKTRFDEYMRRITEAKIPFIKKQKDLLEEKKKENKKLDLTDEERIEIWRSFREILRKITEEIYTNQEKDTG